MSKVSRRLRGVFRVLCVVLLLLVVVAHLPWVQHRAGVALASKLEDKLGTRVVMDGLRWRLPADIILDSLRLDDREGLPLLAADRLAVKMNWRPLIREGRVAIRNIRFYNPTIAVRADSAGAEPNYQFLIDAFSTGKKSELPEMQINSLIIRGAHLTYDIAAEPETPAELNPAHLDVSDLNAHLSLKMLTNDSLSMMMRQLSLKEKSGFQLDDMTFRLVANRQGATLVGFNLRMPQSELRVDSLFADYRDREAVRLKGDVPTSTLAASDLSAFLPGLRGNTSKLTLSTSFKGGTDGRFDVPHLIARLNRRDVDLMLQGQGTPTYVDGKLIRLSVTPSGWNALEGLLGAVDAKSGTELGPLIEDWEARLGATSLTGDAILQMNADRTPQQAKAKFALRADLGEADVEAALKSGSFAATVDTRSLALGKALENSDLGKLTASLNLKGSLAGNPFASEKGSTQPRLKQALREASIDGEIQSIDFKNYTYSPILVNGTWADNLLKATLKVDDPNVRSQVAASYDTRGGHNAYTLHADVTQLNLYNLHLTDKHETSRFAFKVNGNLTGNTLDALRGQIALDSLQLEDPAHTWTMKHFALGSFPNGAQKVYTIDSDFMQMRASGYFTPENLQGSVYNLLMDYEPTLLSVLMPEGAKAARKADKAARAGNANVLTFNATVSDLSLLDELFYIPVKAVNPMRISGALNEERGTLSLNMNVPQLRYDELQFRNVTLNVNNEGSSALRLQAGGEKVEKDGKALMADVMAQLVNDDIMLDAEWRNSVKGFFEGNIHAKADFAKNAAGRIETTLTGMPSTAVINNEAWHFSPFTAVLSDDVYGVDGFRLTSGTQYLALDGSVVAHPQRTASSHADSLSVRLNNINLAPFLSLAKLKGISFGGVISGHADVAGLMTKAPRVGARLEVDSLTFCDAPLGDALAQVGYDDKGIVFDVSSPTIDLGGTASVAEKNLDLTLIADSTDVSFLNAMLTGIMSDVEGRGFGTLHVYGPFTGLDVEGKLTAQNASFTLVPTNVKYEFVGDINFVPGAIRFENLEVFDTAFNPHYSHNSSYAPGAKPHSAILNGDITHSHLQNWGYDLTVRTNNVLALNLPNTGVDPFWTTIYADGLVKVWGSESSNTLNVDVKAESRPNSFFALNLGSSTTSEADFIRFRDRDTIPSDDEIRQRIEQIRAQTGSELLRRRSTQPPSGRRSTQQPSMSIDVNASITPDAEIRLVTDAATDDAINARGSGDLTIRMRNENIGLYGTYTLMKGEYNLSLQDLVTKRFDVVEGSTVEFDGDPLDAKLNITASHTVNSVSLADLSADASSMGNVRVNCLLGISGTPNAPRLTFNIELPQGTEEQKTLLRTYTATDEQMNLQFIYLLGLGKFYTYDFSQASTQGTQGGVAAMQSLLSSTVSSQINSLISNLLPSENWSLSSSIKSDNLLGNYADEEMSMGNMEVQGVLEGRLLNNRLLVNGNFGYRDNPMYASNFIGDFDIRYLLFPRSNLWLKGYNRTNDRYFSKTSLTTQGVGLMFNRDFDGFSRPRRQEPSPVASSDTLVAPAPAETTIITETTEPSEPSDYSEYSEVPITP